MGTTTWESARARVAALSRDRKPDDPDLVQARLDFAAARRGPRRRAAGRTHPSRRAHGSADVRAADRGRRHDPAQRCVVVTPEQRRLRAQIAATARWSRESPVVNARRGQEGLVAKFEREVDPDGTLPPEERARRAASARRSHMLRLSARSSKVRAARRAEVQQSEDARRRGFAALTAHVSGEVTRTPEQIELARLARRASGLPDDAALPDLDADGGGSG